MYLMVEFFHVIYFLLQLYQPIENLIIVVCCHRINKNTINKAHANNTTKE